MQLDGKVALVTGGSSGIGEASARLLAQEGAHVGVLGRTPDETEKVTQSIQKSGGKATTLIADVSDPEALEKAIKQLGDAQGHIDIVLANAGINGTWAPLEELTVEDYRQTMDINFLGTFLTVKYALPYMKQRGGAIVVVSSVNGTRMFSNTGATLYACSKAAQVAFTKMTAIELARYKIRINVICPGAIETEIDENTERQNLEKIQYPQETPKGEIPLTGGKPGSARQVADLVLFLSSDKSSHITGTEVWIDGAESLFRG
ncbi:MAG: SDR family NAD(P)-dependent oxidoreductase [Chloroflexota bacterium]|nr:MAG: 3-oxoacyl-[acyl-carrier-protein] reductase [Chloroflexota bacterium]